MATKKSTDEVYEQNAEASRAKGVVRKGTAAPPKGKVTVTHKRKGLGLKLLSKYQIAVLLLDTVVGLTLIYTSVDDPTLQAHFMWAFGITHLIATVPSFFHKRE